VDKLIDYASVLFWPFAKYEISGPGAEKYLNRVCANNLPTGGDGKGRVSLQHVLTPEGKVYSEVTMCKAAENKYYLVSYPSMRLFDQRFFTQTALPSDGEVQFEDKSGDWCVFMLNGPESMRILQEVGSKEFGEKWAGFTYKDVTIFGDIPVRALKVSFIGELGMELHFPSHEHGANFYRKLIEHDPKITDWGGSAMNSLRLEKGIPLFGKDFTKDHTALEVGIEPRFVKLDKDVDFTGKKALIAKKNDTGPDGYMAKECRKLVMMEVLDLNGESTRWDDTDVADCVGNEPLYDAKSGECIGFTTGGAYGFVSKKSIAMGYVPLSTPDDADLLVDILGTKYKVKLNGAEGFVPVWAQRQKAAAGK
jgi:dimethylglycine dehydrogenase